MRLFTSLAEVGLVASVLGLLGASEKKTRERPGRHSPDHHPRAVHHIRSGPNLDHTISRQLQPAAYDLPDTHRLALVVNSRDQLYSSLARTAAPPPSARQAGTKRAWNSPSAERSGTRTAVSASWAGDAVTRHSPTIGPPKPDAGRLPLGSATCAAVEPARAPARRQRTEPPFHSHDLR